MRRIPSIFLTAALCTLAATFHPQANAQTTHVAYVYVSSNPANSSTNQINAYTVSSAGKLTPVSGSPFRDDVTSMAVNGKYLFASTRSGIYIAGFRIEPGGALRWVRSTDIVRLNPSDCGDSGPLFLDRSGTTLYDMEYRSDCSNNSYHSFSIDPSTGQLRHLGGTFGDAWLYLPAAFTGNNAHAYTAGCIGNLYWEISGYKRGANGALTSVKTKTSLPAAKAGDFYCPSQTATDSANHVAVTLQPVNQAFNPDGAPLLASFTADAAGNLNTSNTPQTMPRASVGTVTALSMSPSGKLLAVAGSAGLQVFHFNGGNAITRGTGLIATPQIDQISWDNSNHLYAISQSAGKLYVFTITPASAQQAAGSPYSIHGPVNIAVQPLTPRP
jgi:6-phosphogluconolactonase (cycloisomerase 2 family)